jgi:hypothetical protein
VGKEDGVADLDVVGEGDVLDLDIGRLPAVEQQEAGVVGCEDVCTGRKVGFRAGFDSEQRAASGGALRREGVPAGTGAKSDMAAREETRGPSTREDFRRRRATADHFTREPVKNL